MRAVVERVCERMNVDPHGIKVTSGEFRNGNYRRVRSLSRDELMAIARGREGEERLRYRFTGLGEKQALVVVSHVREEVPGVIDEWLRLPGEEEVSEQGCGVEMGR